MRGKHLSSRTRSGRAPIPPLRRSFPFTLRCLIIAPPAVSFFSRPRGQVNESGPDRVREFSIPGFFLCRFFLLKTSCCIFFLFTHLSLGSEASSGLHGPPVLLIPKIFPSPWSQLPPLLDSTSFQGRDLARGPGRYTSSKTQFSLYSGKSPLTFQSPR